MSSAVILIHHYKWIQWDVHRLMVHLPVRASVASPCCSSSAAICSDSSLIGAIWPFGGFGGSGFLRFSCTRTHTHILHQYFTNVLWRWAHNSTLLLSNLSPYYMHTTHDIHLCHQLKRANQSAETMSCDVLQRLNAAQTIRCCTTILCYKCGMLTVATLQSASNSLTFPWPLSNFLTSMFSMFPGWWPPCMLTIGKTEMFHAKWKY